MLTRRVLTFLLLLLPLLSRAAPPVRYRNLVMEGGGIRGIAYGGALLELEQQAGVDFVIEPGALQRIPPEYRIIQLDVQRKSVKQVSLKL